MLIALHVTSSAADMLTKNLLQVLFSIFVVFSVEFGSSSASICGNTYFEGSNGTINSPNFPLEYPASLNCTYTISNAFSFFYSRSIYIQISAFSTESCCDRLTITCERGNAFEPRVFAGQRYSSTLLINSCRLAKLLFTSDGSRESTGFSLNYSSIPAQTIIEGFKVMPSNIIIQPNAWNTFSFNCTSTSGYLPWWIYHQKGSNSNSTVTNGFCKVSADYESDFISESLGPGSCNLIGGTNVYSSSRYDGAFICNYGTSESAGAVLVPVNPRFRFSNRLGRSAETIKNLELTTDDVVQYSCFPVLQYFSSEILPNQAWNLYLSNQRSCVVQFRIVLIYWTDDTGKMVSNTTSGHLTISVKAESVSGDYVFPNYTCNIDVKFFSNTTFMAIATPTVLTFSTGIVTVRPSFDKGENLNVKTVIILVAVVGVVILAINVAFTVLFHQFKTRITANTQSPQSTVKKQNEYGPSGKGQPDNLYANEIQCQRLSRRSSQDSDQIYEDV